MSLRDEIEDCYPDDEGKMFLSPNFDSAIVGVVSGISVGHHNKVCYSMITTPITTTIFTDFIITTTD